MANLLCPTAPSGFRNSLVLIHDYDQVDAELVWKTVSHEAVETRRMIEKLIGCMDPDRVANLMINVVKVWAIEAIARRVYGKGSR